MLDTAYTKTQQIIIPDKFFDAGELLAWRRAYTFVALRGSKFTVAVYVDDTVVGWALRTVDMVVEDR